MRQNEKHLCCSYVMGVGKSIYNLKTQGFKIKKSGSNFIVFFNADKSKIWENFISNNLQAGYWNEYLTNNSVIFLFNLQNNIKRYVVYNYENQEVLELCEKLCESKFQSIKSMLTKNKTYRKIINKQNK